ncbi:hypothetical protein M758_UG249000 [Ceratodon purpureus]|nr:hypothetical protein M758_UG249000 [Ceratodon purpureus]
MGHIRIGTSLGTSSFMLLTIAVNWCIVVKWLIAVSAGIQTLCFVSLLWSLRTKVTNFVGFRLCSCDDTMAVGWNVKVARLRLLGDHHHSTCIAIVELIVMISLFLSH